MLFLLRYYKHKFIKRKVSPFSYIGNDCIINDKASIKRFCIIRGLAVDAFSYIGPGSQIQNCSIGKFCSLSKNVTIGAPRHPTNYVSTSPIFFREKNGTKTSWVKNRLFNDSSHKVVIGNDVWIGLNASVMGGVTIGDGAIVGAHSLVTKDVPPYAIVGGVPAKIIKYRFSEEVINLLLEIKWWDIPEPQLRNNIESFSTNASIETLNKLKAAVFPNRSSDE